jgi:hypothetical protein
LSFLGLEESINRHQRTYETIKTTVMRAKFARVANATAKLLAGLRM